VLALWLALPGVLLTVLVGMKALEDRLGPRTSTDDEGGPRRQTHGDEVEPIDPS
jgi:hypothetical protein